MFTAIVSAYNNDMQPSTIDSEPLLCDYLHSFCFSLKQLIILLVFTPISHLGWTIILKHFQSRFRTSSWSSIFIYNGVQLNLSLSAILHAQLGDPELTIQQAHTFLLEKKRSLPRHILLNLYWLNLTSLYLTIFPSRVTTSFFSHDLTSPFFSSKCRTTILPVVGRLQGKSLAASWYSMILERSCARSPPPGNGCLIFSALWGGPRTFLMSGLGERSQFSGEAALLNGDWSLLNGE